MKISAKAKAMHTHMQSGCGMLGVVDAHLVDNPPIAFPDHFPLAVRPALIVKLTLVDACKAKHRLP